MNEVNASWVDAPFEASIMTKNGMFRLKGDKYFRINYDFETDETSVGDEVSESEVWGENGDMAFCGARL